MGTLFWLIYDIIAVAVILLCIYLFGKKGIFKSAIVLVSCLIGLFFSVTVSGNASQSIYRTAVRDNNVSKLDKSLIDIDIPYYLKDSVENMGYNIIANPKKIDEFLQSEKELDKSLYNYLNNINGKVIDNEINFKNNLNQCYSDVMKKIIYKDLSRYAVAVACQKIQNGETDFGNLLKMINSGGQRKDSAEIIDETYTADAYKDVIRLIVCVIIFIVIFAIGFLTSISLGVNQREVSESTGSRIAGGLCGIFIGTAFVFLIAVALRLYIIIGNDENLFFNNPAIDKTFIFRYAYNITYKL